MHAAKIMEENKEQNINMPNYWREEKKYRNSVESHEEAVKRAKAHAQQSRKVTVARGRRTRTKS